MGGNRWRLGGAGDDLSIELPDESISDPVAVQRTKAELERLIWRAFTGRDEQVLRVLRAAVGVLDGRTSPTLDARAIQDSLRFAAFSGRLKVERAERRVVPSPADSTPDAVGPAPSSKGGTTWFSLKVLDEVGDPVDGIDIAYSLGTQRRVVTTNGAGVARLDGVDAGSSASAGIASLAAVKQKLKPRWKTPRDPNIASGPNVVVEDVHDAAGSISVPAETPTTLVLTPYFKCNEIPGAHFAFGRSFVRSSAIAPLAAIAEAITGDDDRKGMIWGHTDLSGPEALNKELSERRAKALHALLTQDADAWEELYSGSADGPNWQEKWDLEEAQHMLNALGVTDDAGSAINEKGIRDASTNQAIHRFQAKDYPDCPAEQADLPKSDFLGKPGRKELFLAYAKRISRQPVPADRLGKIGSAKFMGCGEFNPVSLTVKDEASRRAVVFVYDPAAEPQGLPCELRSMSPCKANCGPLAKELDPDGKPPYRCKIYQQVAKRCPCTPGPDLSHDLLVRLLLTVKEADGMPHVFILESDDGTISQSQKLSAATRATGGAYAELEYKTLPEIHQYRLRCEGVAEPYEVFPYTPYDDLSKLSNPTVPPQVPTFIGAEGKDEGDAPAPADDGTKVA